MSTTVARVVPSTARISCLEQLTATVRTRLLCRATWPCAGPPGAARGRAGSTSVWWTRSQFPPQRNRRWSQPDPLCAVHTVNNKILSSSPVPAVAAGRPLLFYLSKVNIDKVSWCSISPFLLVLPVVGIQDLQNFNVLYANR